MPKVVLDSTVLVSAFLAPQGLSAELLDHAVRGAFQLSLSEDILHETQRVLLEREHLRTKYLYTDAQASEFCTLLRGFAHLITDLPTLTGISRDPDDDMVIASAVAAYASHLITRDKDLLALAHYQEIRIITPEQFMEILRNTSRRSASTDDR